jgi:iron complex outermembrane recepter protein
VAAGLLAGGLPDCARAQPAAEELSRMSLQELTQLQVTSVAKAPQALSAAPAAIYVITHDQIVRSGATSLAEALRLAPNLEVTRVSASDYVVAARGFNGDPQAQNFSNKMLILIDGRSVYSPLFSGVYLDAQAVLLRDVDRIEVISGPGAALWGANAVNGVINIITRTARSTPGTYASVGAGNLTEQIEARYGAEVGDSAAVRVYARAVKRGAMQLADGSSAHDDWYKTQAGFHADWSGENDTVLLEGDTYHALENQATAGAGDLLVSGADLLGRWLHTSARSQLRLQAYIDESERSSPFGGLGALLHTYDLSLQQNLTLGAAGQLVWGAGERVNQYSITNDPTGLSFVPPRRALTLGNLFAQETLPLGASLKLIAGAKLEDDPFAGWQFQPDARLAWTPGDDLLLWAAASRAIRSPTPFETDVVERIGPLLALQGDRAFKPERVTAYEVGYRGRPAATLSLSLSGFYNVYDDLRTIEPTAASFFPLSWGNLMRGDTYGVEGWADWQVLDWWRLSPGFRTLSERLRLEPGASGILGTAQAGDDPAAELKLTSSMTLPGPLDLDATLRHVSALPDPALPAYWELSARLAWQLTSTLELSVTGSNLLHARHLELPTPYGEYIDRSVFARIDWSLR